MQRKGLLRLIHASKRSCSIGDLDAPKGVLDLMRVGAE